MKIQTSLRAAVLFVLALTAMVYAEDFVVKKRKPQSQSMNKLKEDYANELAELVKLIPRLQKQLAALQEDLIEQLYKIIDDEFNGTKCEIDMLTCKAEELRCFLEQVSGTSLPAKSSFIQQNKQKKSCAGAEGAGHKNE